MVGMADPNLSCGWFMQVELVSAFGSDWLGRSVRVGRFSRDSHVDWVGRSGHIGHVMSCCRIGLFGLVMLVSDRVGSVESVELSRSARRDLHLRIVQGCAKRLRLRTLVDRSWPLSKDAFKGVVRPLISKVWIVDGGCLQAVVSSEGYKHGSTTGYGRRFP